MSVLTQIRLIPAALRSAVSVRRGATPAATSKIARHQAARRLVSRIRCWFTGADPAVGIWQPTRYPYVQYTLPADWRGTPSRLERLQEYERKYHALFH